MSTLVLRATKGSPLTNTEVDTNFSNLNTDKLEATYAGAMSSLTGGTSIVTLGTVATGTWNASLIAGQYGGTGVANTGKTITLGGNLTTSGAFASTFTMSAATTVTFPTTGTLATLAGSESLTNKKLGSLTTNGLVTTSGADGTLSVTTLGTGVATFLSTPSSANLISAISDETGSGVLVFATSPTLVTPTLGAATATSINKVAITAPATSATLTIADGTTISTAGNFTTSGAFAMTLTATAATSVTLPISGTLVNTAVTTLSSLVSVGTISTGTWSATSIAATKGGTGLSTYATGDIIYGSATNTLSKLAAGTDGQILTLASGVPAWSTSTAASTGKAIAMAIVFGA